MSQVDFLAVISLYLSLFFVLFRSAVVFHDSVASDVPPCAPLTTRMMKANRSDSPFKTFLWACPIFCELMHTPALVQRM